MSASEALPKVLERIDAELDNSLNRLFELIRIPSISTDSAYKDSCRAAAEHVAKDLAGLGFESAVRPTAGHPVVTAKSDGAANGGPRVLFYGHYDVQPVDPLDLWKNPPFEPKIVDDKLYARGATDDKGQSYAHVKGIAAMLAERGALPVNVKLLVEGEEEAGGVSIE